MLSVVWAASRSVRSHDREQHPGVAVGLAAHDARAGSPAHPRATARGPRRLGAGGERGQ